MGFKEARRRAGLSARRVSVILDVSQQAVFDWEAGRYKPEADRLIKVAKLYGCSTDELLGLDSQDSA